MSPVSFISPLTRVKYECVDSSEADRATKGRGHLAGPGRSVDKVKKYHAAPEDECI
jgi:hypothetical protein